MISGESRKLLSERARKRGPFARILLSCLLISGVLESVYDQGRGNHLEVPPLVFTDGEDTSTLGGIISRDRTQVEFAGIRLAVECDIVITQLVNITNMGFSDRTLKISVSAEDFGSELSSLKISLVSPSGKETLVVELDDSGNIVIENVPVNIPQKEEWAMKLAGHYDSGTPTSQSNILSLHFQVAT